MLRKEYTTASNDIVVIEQYKPSAYEIANMILEVEASTKEDAPTEYIDSVSATGVFYKLTCNGETKAYIGFKNNIEATIISTIKASPTETLLFLQVILEVYNSIKFVPHNKDNMARYLSIMSSQNARRWHSFHEHITITKRDVKEKFPSLGDSLKLGFKELIDE